MNERPGLIAPGEKKALYLDCANIPMALGWGCGSFASKQIYECAGEMAGLALRCMSDVLMVEELPERTQAFSKLTEMLGQNLVAGTPLLWGKHGPSCVWTPFPIAGVIAAT